MRGPDITPQNAFPWQIAFFVGGASAAMLLIFVHQLAAFKPVERAVQIGSATFCIPGFFVSASQNDAAALVNVIAMIDNTPL